MLRATSKGTMSAGPSPDTPALPRAGAAATTTAIAAARAELATTAAERKAHMFAAAKLGLKEQALIEQLVRLEADDTAPKQQMTTEAQAYVITDPSGRRFEIQELGGRRYRIAQTRPSETHAQFVLDYFVDSGREAWEDGLSSTDLLRAFELRGQPLSRKHLTVLLGRLHERGQIVRLRRGHWGLPPALDARKRILRHF